MFDYHHLVHPWGVKGESLLQLNRRANAGVAALRFKCKLSDLSAKSFFI